MEIIELSTRPELLVQAMDRFANQWGNMDNRMFYEDCMRASCVTTESLPRFYIALDGGAMIANYALLRVDLVSRQDLTPWFGCLYVDEDRRGAGIGGALLVHAEEETRRKGFTALHLATDHVGYYERHGFEDGGACYYVTGDETRLYQKTL
ncbi:GNAT family N-acetyltransferase [Exiguobacterium flavidum]|uniref:GNAT family N-acetyltransferase n=1 Tax=Exiguobacterium flavidum TaxID=2184695 RepID=UPI000DF7419D|nr:GNAT family N-acetyltransferase [Exiguobacterium flavidum]